MTRPRCIVPGRTYSIVRRTSRRSFFLRPDPRVNQILGFCLAYACQRFDMALHAVGAMSTHQHTMVTDRRGCLPDFIATLNRLTALCLKAHFGIEENVWAVGTYDAVEITTEDAALEKLVYVLMNPVEAELVPRSKDWPGLISGPWSHQEPPRSFLRPTEYFSNDGSIPDQVELRFEKLPQLSHLGDQEYGERIARALHAEERRVQERAAAAGRTFMGRKRICRQKPTTRPRTPASKGGINPRVAGRDTEARVRALLRLRAFHDAYREALNRLRQGCRDVLFPPGTWRLRVHFGVLCHPFPA